MNLQTFTATTMIECLQKVKQAMGFNAVILHTRTYTKRTWLGLVRREFVEITAGKGIGGPARNRAAPANNNFVEQTKTPSPQRVAAVSQFRLATAAAGRTVPAYADGPVARSLEPIGAVNLALAAPPTQHNPQPGRALLESAAATNIFSVQVAKDVEDLKKLVSGLVDSIHRKDAPDVPEELFDYYLRLIQNQVATELAGEIMGTLKKQIRPEYLKNDAFVKDKLAEQIEKLIPTTGPITRTKKTGPHVVALIGPTGVGKTTTIAKLAAKLKLVEKKSVGLITIDTYRIAAIDQLKRYADILQCPLRVTNSADDLREAVRSISDCEYILIDTAGRSPRDAMKINELRGFLDAAAPDEIHLVLCSTASQDCVELAVEKFSAVNFDKVIFTKLDEAAHVGVVLNAIRKLNKSLSYITTGQNVPDDIETGDGRRLARLILGEGL
ncbi:MAG: flagellar biosynthesis protein FlhF [Anaerolineae bacterium]|nr:flagellar biosynthesis protein FlhF [Phycisphaerae bacterium]